MSISNSQYDAIMRTYEETRLNNKHLMDEHRSEVYDLIPEYKVLDEKVSNLSVEHVKKKIAGEEDAIDELHNKIAEISEKKRILLETFGFPSDYLMPIYTCKDCKDTGYIDGMTKCHCLKQAIVRVCYRQSNIEEILKVENFDNLSFEYYNDSEILPMRQIVSDCKAFVDEFDSSYDNLLFYGNVGVGKTYLTNCIAKELLDKGHSVLYFSAFHLFDTLADYVFRSGNDTEEKSRIHEDIFNCDLLIIDDLGTENINSFVSSQLFLILNERDARRKSTIISTNLSMEALADNYSERTFSRIYGHYRIIKPDIQDLRIKLKKLNIRK